MSEGEYKVPKAMRPYFEAIVGRTDSLCRAKLSEEYAELARQMAAALARKRPSPISRGRVDSWACGIIYALGRVNFMFDHTQVPHLSAAELCEYFGVAKSTAANKAKAIDGALKIKMYDVKWSLPSQLAAHPTAWMIVVDGLIIDARHAPLEIQLVAYRRGLIPYVYGQAS